MRIGKKRVLVTIPFNKIDENFNISITKLFEKVSDKNSKKVSDKFPEKVSDKILEKSSITSGELSDIITEKVSDKNSEKVSDKLLKKVSDKNISKTQMKILVYLRDNPNITYKQLALKVGLSKDSIKKNIYLLKKWGLIIRVGTKRRGYWNVVS